MVRQSSATELIIVRHGETKWNAQGLQQGQLDSPLTGLGVRQADAIAQALVRCKFQSLYSSDLGRAVATAERISARTGRKVIRDPRLRERRLGIMQGLTMAEFEQAYPAEYATFRSGDIDYVLPDGESIRQRYDRVIACLEQIAASRPGEQVVIVTHGGSLDSAFRRAMQMDLASPRTFKLYNASINSFFIDRGQWRMGMWGSVEHLGDLETSDDW